MIDLLTATVLWKKRVTATVTWIKEKGEALTVVANNQADDREKTYNDILYD